jgi:hypothetical protein
MIMFKDVGVDPVPNYTRDVKKGIARWDAYLHVPDPDALAAEFLSRNVEFPYHSKIPMMACVDSNSRTLTATCCFSVVLVHEREVKLDSAPPISRTSRQRRIQRWPFTTWRSSATT